jgi:hypothetical protein
VFFDKNSFFERAAQELLPHLLQKLTIASHDVASPNEISIVCEQCNHILLEFLRQSGGPEKQEPVRLVASGNVPIPCIDHGFKIGVAV